MRGRSVIEGYLVDWSLDQPTEPRRACRSRCSTTTRRRRSCSGCSATGRWRPPTRRSWCWGWPPTRPTTTGPAARAARVPRGRGWAPDGELPGVSEFFAAELALVLNCGRGTAAHRPGGRGPGGRSCRPPSPRWPPGRSTSGARGTGRRPAAHRRPRWRGGGGPAAAPRPAGCRCAGCAPGPPSCWPGARRRGGRPAPGQAERAADVRATRPPTEGMGTAHRRPARRRRRGLLRPDRPARRMLKADGDDAPDRAAARRGAVAADPPPGRPRPARRCAAQLTVTAAAGLPRPARDRPGRGGRAADHRRAPARAAHPDRRARAARPRRRQRCRSPSPTPTARCWPPSPPTSSPGWPARGCPTTPTATAGAPARSPGRRRPPTPTGPPPPSAGS